MSAPTLPPPPGAPGWDQPPPSTRPRTLLDQPASGQGRPGWVLLNVEIALGTAFGAYLVSVLMGMIGRTQAQDDADDGPIVVGTLLVLAASIVGWFVFAYLDRSLARRWGIFGLLVAGSTAIAAILFQAASR
jgi:hypothetical protein